MKCWAYTSKVEIVRRIRILKKGKTLIIGAFILDWRPVPFYITRIDDFEYDCKRDWKSEEIMKRLIPAHIQQKAHAFYVVAYTSKIHLKEKSADFIESHRLVCAPAWIIR